MTGFSHLSEIGGYDTANGVSAVVRHKPGDISAMGSGLGAGQQLFSRRAAVGSFTSMGPRPAHPTFMQSRPRARHVALALALGARRSRRLAYRWQSGMKRLGDYAGQLTATQILAAAEWDQWSFWGESDGSMQGKWKWRQIVALLDSDEES